jgi:esterase/lipase
MPLDVIVQDINSRFAYVNYLNMKVMICKEDNYINMTKIVNMFETRDGNKKELKHWFNNQSSKDLIEYLSEKLGPNTKTRYLLS